MKSFFSRFGKGFGAATFHFILIFGLSTSANAAGWVAASVNSVELTSTGHLIVWSSATNECGSSRLDYVTDNDPTERSMLAALLAWQAQGKSVQFYIDHCSGNYAIFADVYNQ